MIARLTFFLGDSTIATSILKCGTIQKPLASLFLFELDFLWSESSAVGVYVVHRNLAGDLTVESYLNTSNFGSKSAEIQIENACDLCFYRLPKVGFMKLTSQDSHLHNFIHDTERPSSFRQWGCFH